MGRERISVSTPTVSFLAVGDVYLRRPDPASAFRHFDGLFRSANLRFCNLEGPCSHLGTPTIGKYITIGMQPTVVPALKAVGFDLVAFANNHALDYGYEAFLDTLERLDAAGIARIGGGRDLAEARRPVILERNGLRVGCLAYAATIPWGYEAAEGRPGITPIRVQTYYEPRYQIMSEQPGMPARVVNVIHPEDLATLVSEVQQLKKEAHAVIVSFHWGVAFLPDPAPYQPELAHAVVEAGADLVLGHHPHVLQGVEVYRGVPIFYSLSNFVFDRENPRFGEETMLVLAEFGPDGLARTWAYPALLPRGGDPRPADTGEGAAINSLLERLSAGMNSRFQREGERIEILAA